MAARGLPPFAWTGWLSWIAAPSAILLWAAWWWSVDAGLVDGLPGLPWFIAASFALLAFLLPRGWTVPCVAIVTAAVHWMLHTSPCTPDTIEQGASEVARATWGQAMQGCVDLVPLGIVFMGGAGAVGGALGAIMAFVAFQGRREATRVNGSRQR